MAKKLPNVLLSLVFVVGCVDAQSEVGNAVGEVPADSVNTSHAAPANQRPPDTMATDPKDEILTLPEEDTEAKATNESDTTNEPK